MTPGEAAKLLERLSPVVVRMKLVQLLVWQQRKGKALVNFGWYLRCLKYGQEPRLPKAGAEGRAKVKQLTQAIGR